MQAAVLIEPSTYKIKNVDFPDVVSNWPTIRVAACGICGSDLAIYDRNPPIPKYWPGHEIAGYLDGQLVAVNPLVSCGNCVLCNSGKENICQNAKMISSHLPGGFAEYVKVPSRNIRSMKTNENSAACVEPLASCVHMLNIAPNIENKSVAIIGGGTIGLLLLQLAYEKGAKAVKLVARHSFQNQLGTKWQSKDLGTNPEVVLIATAGDGLALEQAIGMSQPAGKVVIIGNIYNSRPLDLKWLVERELTVLGSQRYTAVEFEFAAQLIESKIINVDALITHEFNLSEISLAYSVALEKNKHGSIKVLIKPHDNK